MSKVLEAKAVGGIVTAGGVPVPSAKILSGGVAQSEGFLILDEARAYYVANPSIDLKTTIEKLITVIEKASDGLNKAVSALTAIDTAAYIKTVTPGSGGAGGIPALPVAASDIAGITTAVTGLTAVKTELTTLKGALQ